MLYEMIKKNANITILVTPSPQFIKDQQTRNKILEDAHYLPSSGHVGISKMYQTLRLRYHWPGRYVQGSQEFSE